MAEKNETENDGEVKKGSGLMGLVKAVALISVLVIVEVVAAGMLIPSANDTEALAHELAAAERGEEVDAGSEKESEDEAAEDEEIVEVEIGTFSVTRYNPEADKTVNVDFELYATVLTEDQAEFTERFESNRNRVREQVQMTLFGAKSSDLATDLELIKRRILEKTNHALGRPLVQQVLLTRFNFVER